jgi:hypothetical protein
MKFGYRDRIVLLIACVVIILGIGIFVFIKPKYEKMRKDEKSLKDERDSWALKLDDYAGIPKYQKSIQEKRDDANTIALNFTDEMDATKLDQFLQENFLNTEKNIQYDTKLQGALSVSDESATSVGYYYYTPNIVSYPLMEYADLDGSLQKALDEKRADQAVFGTRAVQSVGVGNANFAVKISKENCMEFIDAVRKFAEDHSDAMILNSVSIEDIKFNGGKTVERDKDGKLTGTRPENLPDKYKDVKDEDLGYSNVNFNYSVYYMQEPTGVDVGPEYQPSIWDGNEWRNYKAPEQKTE